MYVVLYFCGIVIEYKGWIVEFGWIDGNVVVFVFDVNVVGGIGFVVFGLYC